MAVGYGIAAPKPIKTIRQVKDRAKRQKGTRAAEVRVYVFARERDVCRCCRKRRAESRHELRFRSLGGKINRQNCVAVCGDGVQGCHGFLQRNEIAYAFAEPALGAESVVLFTVKSAAAADWMQIGQGIVLVSEPMCVMEAAE